MNNRVYFNTGDVVSLKKDIANAPRNMMVESVDKTILPVEGQVNRLLGVTCIWFSDAGVIQTHRFDTKDLKHYKDV